MKPIVGLFYISLPVECNRISHNKQRNHPKAHGDTQSDNLSRFILMETIVTLSMCRGSVQKGSWCNSLIHGELLWDK